MDLSFEPVERPSPAFWVRWRGLLLVMPLMVGLVVSATFGAGLLLAEPEKADPLTTPSIVTCWNGEQKARAECGLPGGVAGLRWVFPSFKPLSGRCERTQFADRGAPRPLEVVCVERIRDTPVTITYTRRTTVRRGQSYVASNYPGIKPGRSEKGELLTYRAPAPEGGYRLTRLYDRYPFSVSIVAPSKALREEALKRLVSSRSAAQISVQPTP